MVHAFGESFRKSSILVIDKKIIRFVKVVRYVYIGPAVRIDVGDSQSEAEAENVGSDASAVAYVFEPVIIVPVKFACEMWILLAAYTCHFLNAAGILLKRMI